MPKKKYQKHSHHKKNGRTTRTRRETTDDDDGVKPAFGSSVRAENARGLSKRRRRFRYVLDFVFLYILRDDESLLYWSKILDRMNSFKVVFLVLTRKLSLSLSLFKNNRQRRSDDQRVTNVHELQDSADENGRGVPGDERKSVDFVRGIAVRVNGGAFNIHEITIGNEQR